MPMLHSVRGLPPSLGSLILFIDIITVSCYSPSGVLISIWESQWVFLFHFLHTRHHTVSFTHTYGISPHGSSFSSSFPLSSPLSSLLRVCSGHALLIWGSYGFLSAPWASSYFLLSQFPAHASPTQLAFLPHAWAVVLRRSLPLSDACLFSAPGGQIQPSQPPTPPWLSLFS